MVGHANRLRIGHRRNLHRCRINFSWIVVRQQVLIAYDRSVGGVVNGGPNAVGIELIEAEPVAAPRLPARVVAGDALAHPAGGAFYHIDFSQADRLRSRGYNRYRHEGAVGADAGSAVMGTGAFQHNLPVYGQRLETGGTGDPYIARQPAITIVLRGKHQRRRHACADNVEAYTKQRYEEADEKEAANGRS